MKQWLKILLAAGLAALCGCAEKKPQAEIGKWHLVEMISGDTAYAEEDLAAQGIVSELVLRKSGEGTYTLNGEASSLQWADGLIRLDGEEIPYELNGRHLVLHREDTRMTFARGSAPVPSAAAAPEPSQQPGPPDIPDLSGYYELTAYVQDGETVTDGGTAWLYLDETGGGWLQLGGETQELAYDGNLIMIADMPLDYSLEDGLLTVWDESMSMVFAYRGEEAPDEPAEAEPQYYVLFREITPEGTYSRDELEHVVLVLEADGRGSAVFGEITYDLIWTAEEVTIAGESWQRTGTDTLLILHSDEYTMVFMPGGPDDLD
ncbi:MAG: hypothetical protein IJH44_10055 [Solobacterium sp.]|nr:hypothetical protein [Solobacterium sp.]